jgi:S1-C subfamily serine protease
MLSLLLAFVAASPQAPLSKDNPRWTPEVQVVADVAPCVVYIEASRPMMVGYQFNAPVYSDEVTSGSGVVIEKSGYIVTNYHVVGNDARSITVQFAADVDPNAKRYDAELVSAVAKDDLALLKINGDREFPVVRRGISSDLHLGERVIAIGNPLQQKLTVSTGIVSGLNRDLKIEGGSVPLHFTDLIQTDAAINRGNSGGPLLNILGELIGINSAVNPYAENMGYAIPVDRVEEVLRDQLLAPSSSRAWLGFEVDDTASMCITRVTPDGPAAREGMDVGYRLLAINGRAIKSSEDYRLLRLPILPNQPVRVRVASASGERELVLRGWNRADGTTFERMGLTVQNFAVGRGLQWVRIDQIAKSGPATALGLKPGDVIASLRVLPNGQPWSTPSAEDLAGLVSGLEPGTELRLEILRDENGDGRMQRDELYNGTLVLR